MGKLMFERLILHPEISGADSYNLHSGSGRKPSKILAPTTALLLMIGQERCGLLHKPAGNSCLRCLRTVLRIWNT